MGDNCSGVGFEGFQARLSGMVGTQSLLTALALKDMRLQTLLALVLLASRCAKSLALQTDNDIVE